MQKNTFQKNISYLSASKTNYGHNSFTLFSVTHLNKKPQPTNFNFFSKINFFNSSKWHTTDTEDQLIAEEDFTIHIQHIREDLENIKF